MIQSFDRGGGGGGGAGCAGAGRAGRAGRGAGGAQSQSSHSTVTSPVSDSKKRVVGGVLGHRNLDMVSQWSICTVSAFGL